MRSLLLTVGFVLIAVLVGTGARAQEEDTRYVAKSASVAMLQAPAPDASILMRLTPGEQVTVLDEQGDFVNVRSVSGLSGWVAASDVTTDVPAEEELAAANTRIEELEGQVASLQGQLRNARAAAQRASQQLDSTQDSVGAEVARLQEELEAAGETVAELRTRNAALETEIAEYELAEESRQMLARTEADRRSTTTSWREHLWLFLGIGLGLLVAGFATGYELKKRRIRARFRGLDI